MAIQKFSQIGAGRNADYKADFNRTYTVVFRVIVDDPYDGPATVVNHPDCPRPFISKYVGYDNTSDVAAYCTGIKPEQDGEEWMRWRITCTFATNWQNQPPQEEDPENEPPIFWIETEFVNKKITQDADGEDIKNSAGQLIDGLEREEAVETWVWEKNFNSLNRSFWKEYQNAVNEDQFFEIDPKEGRLHIVVPKPSFRNGNPFWRVQFRIKVNPEKWTVNPADRGTMVKGSDGKLSKPADRYGNPMDGEVYLKEDGTQQFDSTAAIRYIGEKDVYTLKPFSGAFGF